MNELTTLNLYLRSISARHGIEGLTLNESGTCALDYQDTTFCLEYLDSASCLRLYAPLASVAAIVPADEVSVLWQTLLKANLTHPDLLSAHFAMHPTEDIVMLLLQVPVEHLDDEVLERHLINFLMLLEGWSRRFASGGALVDLLAPIHALEAQELEAFFLGLPEPGNQPVQETFV
jgi:hypothetical protein